VTGVRVSEALAVEHMTEMSIAAGADNLDAMAVGVGVACHLSLEFVIEARPAAATVKFA